MKETFVPYHQHFIAKCYITNPPREESVLNQWFTDLVHKVGMNVVAGPTSVYVSDPGNEGLTGTVTLATSHSSIHIWDNYEIPMAQFDIYSCKCFDVDTVLNHFKEWGLVSAEWIMIDRNEGLSVSQTGSYSAEIAVD
jgi:S-adenosylmethionine/arginine decarboxylase-like enzyme